MAEPGADEFFLEDRVHLEASLFHLEGEAEA
jgi:hypothetical protein